VSQPTEQVIPAPSPAARVSERPARLPYRAQWGDRFAEVVIKVLASVAVLAIFLIFVFIGKEAIPLFFEPEAQEELGGLGALFSPRQWSGYDEPVFVWQPVGETGKFNVVPLFVGTLKITLLAMLIAVPIAVLAAVYVSQYAGRRGKEILKPAIELLASVPSVVLGFFALMVLATLAQDLFGLTLRSRSARASTRSCSAWSSPRRCPGSRRRRSSASAARSARRWSC